MAEKTKIEWCDATFNPWRGCQKVSPGCDNCYAEVTTKRLKLAEWGPGAERVPQSEKYWRQPRNWNAAAAKAGERRKVFCGSMIDVFDNQAPPGSHERLWALIQDTPNLDWQLLTKRPENIAEMLPDDWGEGYPNVWLGVSAEDQVRYDHRWPILAKIPAAIYFVSYEPALGPILFRKITRTIWCPDWIIVGGESGPGARPMDPQWARQVRDDCPGSGTAFFFKQWGTYKNNPLAGLHVYTQALDPPSNGKGGALLDGRLWREFPEVQL